MQNRKIRNEVEADFGFRHSFPKLERAGTPHWNSNFTNTTKISLRNSKLFGGVNAIFW
jgi:hypothetical protein